MSATADGAVLRACALLSDCANTWALKSGQVRSPLVALEYANVKTPNRAFESMVAVDWSVAFPR